jgi:gliding motility-associated-like protein
MFTPATSLPSYDVFTAKYTGAGNFLWVKKGSAKYTDRGLDIVTDSFGDIYVCGQFSDTITFDVVHNNTIMNAIFLVKYNSSGNEQWFRKASASSCIAYALAINNSNQIYMAGDFTGTMGFYGTTTNFLTGSYSNRIFLTRFDMNGNYQWGVADASKNYLSARNLSLDNAGDAYVIGEYGCTLSDYSDATAPGLFNSIGYTDIFVTKYDGSNGSRKWMRNVGGPAKDEAHGITVPTLNGPVIAGSYEKRFSWPVSAAWACNVYPPAAGLSSAGFYQANNYCSDSNYDEYRTIISGGFSDAVVGKIIDLTREPYDYYRRAGTLCSRPFLKSCIYNTISNCPDSVKSCGPGKLYTDTYTDYFGWGPPSAPSLGPYHHYLWSTGDTTSYTNLISMSGYYNVSVTTLDGCYTSKDTVYMKINPVPSAPWITDTKGFNTQKYPLTNKIKMCDPDTVKVTGGNLQSCSFQWGVGLGGPWLSLPDSSMITTKAGWYSFKLTNSFGCEAITSVIVEVDSINPLKPKIKINDTIALCCNTGTFVNLYDSITNPSGNLNCIGIIDTLQWYATPATGWINSLLNCGKPEDAFFSTCTSGNYTITALIKINNSCGTQTYTVSRSFYAKVNPKPVINLTFSGLNQFCPGDSTKIIITHNYPIQWGYGGSINTNNSTKDTVWIKHSGSYYITSSYTDPLTGCSNNAALSFSVGPKPNPFLNVLPKIVCPNDSVKITCSVSGALNYQWVGPGGPISGSTQFIWVKIPGFYHCIVTDAQGCMLTSNTVEVKVYNTPYLVANPSSVVCAGQSVVLKVITNDSSLVQWLPPLSGGGTQKVVTSSGTYSVKVTACGIATTCTIAVVSSSATANIAATATVFCPGDSAKLSSNTGMAGYNWLPGNIPLSEIYVYSAGVYTLVTTNAYGCTKAATIAITQNTSTPIPSASNASICAGQSATLSATGSGTINWHIYPIVGGLMSSGNTFITPPLLKDTVFYISNANASGCNSLRVPVYVYIIPASIKPMISVNNPVCKNDTIQLSSSGISSATGHWSGPNGFSSSQQNPFISSADSSHSGTYQLYLTGGGCTSAIASLTVNVLQPKKPLALQSQTVCAGDSILLKATSGDSSVIFNWNGPIGFTSANGTITIVSSTTAQSGVYSVFTNMSGCPSDSSSINVMVKPTPMLSSALISSGCKGDSIVLWSDTLNGTTYNWSGPGAFSCSNNYTILPLNPSTAGTYTFFADLNGCKSPQQTYSVNFNMPPAINLSNDTMICNGWTLTFNIGNFPYIQWQDFSSASSYSITNNSSGLYFVTVVDSNGCTGSDSVNVSYLDCEEAVVPNVFSPNGDGVNDVFYVQGNFLQYDHLYIYDRWGKLQYESVETQKGWNGKNLNSKDCTLGVYFYIAQVTTKKGEAKTLKGFVHLFR